MPIFRTASASLVNPVTAVLVEGALDKARADKELEVSLIAKKFLEELDAESSGVVTPD